MILLSSGVLFFSPCWASTYTLFKIPDLNLSYKWHLRCTIYHSLLCVLKCPPLISSAAPHWPQWGRKLFLWPIATFRLWVSTSSVSLLDACVIRSQHLWLDLISLSLSLHICFLLFSFCVAIFGGQLLNNKQLHLVRIEVSWWNEWPLSNYLKCRLEYFWDLNTDIQTFTQDTHVDSHGILIDLSWLHQSYHVNRVVTIWQTQYD